MREVNRRIFAMLSKWSSVMYRSRTRIFRMGTTGVRTRGAPGKNGIAPFPDPFLASPHDRQVGDQSHIEKNHAHGEVGPHGEDVPDQGGPEVDPQLPLVRVGEEDVEDPGATPVPTRYW